MTDLNSVANSSLSSLGSSGAGAAPPPFGTMMSSAAAAGGNRYNLDPYLSSRYADEDNDGDDDDN